jgi:ankyrin repeat protein
MSTLYKLAQRGDAAGVSAMIRARKRGATPDAEWHKILARAACIASANDHVHVLQVLLEATGRGGAFAGAFEYRTAAVVQAAIAFGSCNTLRLLLEAGVEYHSENALWFAAQRGRVAVAALLLEHRVDVDGETAAGCAFQTHADAPLIAAVVAQELQMVDFLLLVGADANGAGAQPAPLAAAAMGGDVVIMEALLRAGADVDGAPHLPSRLSHERKRNPLRVAARFGHSTAVQVLLKAKANYDAQGFSRRTPLHLAACRGCAATVAALLRAKAKADFAAAPSLLSLAAAQGHVRVATMLLRAKACGDADRHVNFSPLSTAAQGGHAGMVSLLLRAKASVEGGRGVCILEAMATRSWCRTFARMLPIPDGHGLAEIERVRGGARADVVRLLVCAKTDVHSRVHSPQGVAPGPAPVFKDAPQTWHTLLSLAVMNNKLQVAKALVAAGADVNAPDWHGLVPFAHAVRFHYSMPMVEFLLAAKACADSGRRMGTAHATHLEVLFRYEQFSLDVVKAVLAAKADVRDDAKGRDLVRRATDAGALDVAALLIQAKAHVGCDAPLAVGARQLAHAQVQEHARDLAQAQDRTHT